MPASWTLAVATADAKGAASVELLKLELKPEFREQAVRGRQTHVEDRQGDMGGLGSGGR